MSLNQTMRAALLAYETNDFTLNEAIDFVMKHLTDRYIPKYKLGGCKLMISSEYNCMDVTAAHAAHMDYDIYFRCEDGRVCFVETEQEERSTLNGTQANRN
jgi:hypothetical protein